MNELSEEECSQDIITYFFKDTISQIADNEEEFNYILRILHYSNVIFEPSDFAENPYLKNIKIKPQSIGKFELGYDSYEPYELFCYAVPLRVADSGLITPNIGCFKEEFEFPYIRENGQTWMTITPNEILTIKKSIEKAKGKVLTLGLGMGYFAYMASIKPGVENVTIVEQSQEVIDLFTECILPQFERKDKIHIIKADAIEYLKEIKDGEYDYCFADIWMNSLDLENYFAVKEVGRTFRKTEFDYWIEDSLVMNLTSNVYIELLSCYYRKNGIEANELPEEYSKRQKFIKKLLASTRIATPTDINNVLNPEYLIKLIDKTNIKFSNM